MVNIYQEEYYSGKTKCIKFPFVNSLSMSLMLILAVAGFKTAALSSDARARLMNSVSSTTLSLRIGTVTTLVEMIASKVRVTVVSL